MPHLQAVEPDMSDRRESNEGFRKLDLQERVLMFLTRLRRNTTFEELGYQYGCGITSASRYFAEYVKIFVEHFVPRLLFPRSPDELREMTRAEVRESYPHLLAILDATNWEQLKPENFLENRISYSAYKHLTAFQVLLGELLPGSTYVTLRIFVMFVVLVVSTQRLILWRSEIFGGISNEISVILDESTLLTDMKGIAFGLWLCVLYFHFFLFVAMGYLKERDRDPTAVVCLADSAYHRSALKEELGLGLPVPQSKDGVQQKVRSPFLSPA